MIWCPPRGGLVFPKEVIWCPQKRWFGDPKEIFWCPQKRCSGVPKRGVLVSPERCFGVPKGGACVPRALEGHQQEPSQAEQSGYQTTPYLVPFHGLIPSLWLLRTDICPLLSGPAQPQDVLRENRVCRALPRPARRRLQ